MANNQWLRAAIATGFQKLFVLRLQNTPPEDALIGTVMVWLEALESSHIDWDERMDQARVVESFRILCRTADRWPLPKQFFDALPRRPELPALPLPDIDPQKRRENLNRLKVMINDCSVSAPRAMFPTPFTQKD